MAQAPGWVRKFLAESDLDAVARAVAEAEARTSGEIRVHLDARCAGDPMERAVAVFERLGMHRTALRNAVLVYLAIEDHKLAVIGDTGVDAHVSQEYWDRLRDTLVKQFREGRPREGLAAVVSAVGETLRQHFPRQSDDRDELSDQVSVS